MLHGKAGPPKSVSGPVRPDSLNTPKSGPAPLRSYAPPSVINGIDYTRGNDVVVVNSSSSSRSGDGGEIERACERARRSVDAVWSGVECLVEQINTTWHVDAAVGSRRQKPDA